MKQVNERERGVGGVVGYRELLRNIQVAVLNLVEEQLGM
jgi:hypothetical protein